MDPSSLIVAALSAGAVSAVKETAKDSVKAGYEALKALIHTWYPSVEVVSLEKSPLSPNRQKVIVEELLDSSAATDQRLLEQARILLIEIHDTDPDSAHAAGVIFHDLSAGTLDISDVSAHGAGAFGFRADRAEIRGGVNIKGVRATSESAEKKT